MGGSFQIVEALNTQVLGPDQAIDDDESDCLVHHLQLDFVNAKKLGEQVLLVSHHVLEVVLQDSRVRAEQKGLLRRFNCLEHEALVVGE